MTYIVASGDTLNSIAAKYNIPVDLLMRLNGLTGTEIQSGMILIVSPSVDPSYLNPPLGAEWCPRLYFGSRGPAVEELQRRLSKRRYYTGSIDGIFGSGVEQAVINYQMDNRIPATGVVDPATWAALEVYCQRPPGGCPTLRYGNRGSAIAFLQSLLQRKGYSIIITGIYGRETEDVVRQFQNDYGLASTGEADQAVWNVLGVSCVPVDHDHSGPPLSPDTPDWGPPPGTGGLSPDTPDWGPPPGSGGTGTLPPWGPPPGEPGLNGLNFNWQEIGGFRYLLATDRTRYIEGQKVLITFKKRNLGKEPAFLKYPSTQLFDFYISDDYGNEVWRWSTGKKYDKMIREIILAPGESEDITIVWNQKTSTGFWVVPGTYTLWGTNTATGVSIPLNFKIV